MSWSRKYSAVFNAGAHQLAKPIRGCVALDMTTRNRPKSDEILLATPGFRTHGFVRWCGGIPSVDREDLCTIHSIDCEFSIADPTLVVVTFVT